MYEEMTDRQADRQQREREREMGREGERRLWKGRKWEIAASSARSR